MWRLNDQMQPGAYEAPPACKIQGKLCFQGKLKLLKNPER